MHLGASMASISLKVSLYQDANSRPLLSWPQLKSLLLREDAQPVDFPVLVLIRFPREDGALQDPSLTD